MKKIRADHQTFFVRNSDYKRIQRARRGYGADLAIFSRLELGERVLHLWAFGSTFLTVRPLKRINKP